METKSRYEVISDLEGKKRKLIQERDGLDDVLRVKERELREIGRAKTDQITAWDRKLEDSEEDLKNIKDTMAERKETIKELILSVDESLQRFGKMADRQLAKKNE